MRNGKILHLSGKLSLSSEGCLTETSDMKGPDLVPTSDNFGSEVSEKSSEGEAEIDNIIASLREADEAFEEAFGVEAKALGVDKKFGEGLENEGNDVTSPHGEGSEQDNGGTDGYKSMDSGNRMASDAAGGMAGNRDRSAIRVYEEGLDSDRVSHTDDSERNRRRTESERLVETAKENGQFIERREVHDKGERVSKRSGESEVIIDRDNNRVIKLKDPYAKSPMKSGVSPEDAIYEHLVHNKYFPETSYGFEGISEDIGDVRIVLSQDFIKSAGQPTKEQIDAALADPA